MAKASYSEKLLDPRWQKKRLEILQYNDFTCQACADTETTLHVHHNMYAKGRGPWEYEIDQYTVLCKHCHSAQHANESDLFFEVMSRLPVDGPFSKEEVAIIVAGMTGYEFNPEIKFHDFLYFLGKKLEENYWEFLRKEAKK